MIDKKRILFLIRHAMVVPEPATPAPAWRLSANGRFQAQQLARRIAARPSAGPPTLPTRVITSLEPKAQETGAIMAETWSVPWEPAPGLQEHDRRGAPYFENKADFETAVRQFFDQPEKLVFGRETAVDAQRRFRTAVYTQLAQYPNDTLAVVAHGTVITLFIAGLDPSIRPFEFWRHLSLPDVQIVTVPDCD